MRKLEDTFYIVNLCRKYDTRFVFCILILFNFIDTRILLKKIIRVDPTPEFFSLIKLFELQYAVIKVYFWFETVGFQQAKWLKVLKEILMYDINHIIY